MLINSITFKIHSMNENYRNNDILIYAPRDIKIKNQLIFYNFISPSFSRTNYE